MWSKIENNFKGTDFQVCYVCFVKDSQPVVTT